MGLRAVRRPDSLSEVAARLAGVLYLGFTSYYLFWRATSSLNYDALWLSLPLFLAECYGFISFALFIFIVWRVSPPEERAPAADVSVDVFITTYDEDVSVLRATALGCIAMEYPHKTYILDDGRRLEVKRLAKELRCEYISRPDNAHAKAGNINNAMKHTDGEFIAVFDADQVPHPDFLVQTIGHFRDEEVALVQTPQEFYNLDSMQHVADARDGSAWHEQSLFYSVIQPGKDRLNATFWCGSNAVLRRSALERIGGVATGTITEDIHTTMLLHRDGWKSRYVNRTLATGIAPPDYGAFLVQRLRWAQGSMQLLRSSNPLIVSGLTWQQRINYWVSMTTYLESYQKMIYLLIPLVVLFTGVLPIRSLGFDFAIRFVPYMLLGQLANSLLSRGYGRHFLVEQFNLLKSFIFIRASFTLISGRQLEFKVTPKTVTERSKRRTVDLGMLSPYLVVVGATVAAIVWGVVVIAPGLGLLTGRLAIYLTAGWAFYNAGVVALALRMVLGRSYRRKTYRFPVEMPMRFAIDGRRRRYTDSMCRDLNAEGASFTSSVKLDSGTPLRALFELPDGRLIVSGVARHSVAVDTPEGRSYRVGMLFTTFQGNGQDRLLRFLFDDVVAHQQEGASQPQRAAA